MTESNQVVIIGAGYTGRYLHALTKAKQQHVLASSREPTRHLRYVEPADRIEFDLARQATWKNIPAAADLIWCFPATPLARVRAFAKTLGAPPRRLIVLGSTSAYDLKNASKEYPPPWVDETTPIDLSKPRVQGEEYLRQHHGAIVLRVAGIYGPGRNPLDWIRQGRVKPTRKYVNLIHVEDLAAICLLALEKGKPGEVYNISDGIPRTWEELSRFGAVFRQDMSRTFLSEPQSGKRVSNTKLITDMSYRLRHADLAETLERLNTERDEPNHATETPG